MVHVDLQYLIVYLMSAALCLKEGGCLMMTLANAVSELGFKELIEDAKNRYETQDLPGSKFEWVSPEIAQGVLERLGFSVRFLLPFESLEEERDLHLVATLVDPSRAMRFREWL